jgi:hypothetical protein
MLSEASSGATAARRAPELVWVAVDFDRPRERRRRGWCSGLRIELFIWAALIACLLLCLLAIVFAFCIRTTPAAMLTPPQARRSGPGGAGPKRGPRIWTAMRLCREVERNVSRDIDFSLPGKLYQTRQLVLCQFPAPGSPLVFTEPLS